ncbi:putative C6 finger domain protein [Coniochaeta sp. 2T2.1]|nr:putative C6 finger domain protein [Coniochaeta sp. 2T2.1]
MIARKRNDMDNAPRRHCWECRRRCLVCDFTRPACKRCTSSGALCPGYSDTKPPQLRWLAPGRVTSRRHKGRRARSSGTDASRPNTSSPGATTVAATAPPSPPESHQKSVVVPIPRLELMTEVHVIFEAVEYFNTCIYQDLVPLRELGPNPTIYPILPHHVEASALFPDYIRLSLIATTLTHRLNRTRDAGFSKKLMETFYLYRGLALRSLREDIDVEHKRTSDVVLAGIMNFLLLDVGLPLLHADDIVKPQTDFSPWQVQQGCTSNWRHHLDGVQKLITLRGGMRGVAQSKPLEASLLCFVLLAVIGNTTCPASDMTTSQWHLDQLDFILERYGSKMFPFLTCPPPLFAEIVKVNHLRMRAIQQQGLGTTEGVEILHRLDLFSAEEWALSKPYSIKPWLSIGNVYKASITIYCILSLQSLSVLPQSDALRARCATEGRNLQWFLAEAASSPGIGRFMLWPLVMLGVEAVNGPQQLQQFVQQQLPEMSRHVGSFAPLTAKSVLEKFWASGHTSWDACFDKPYAFATQIAVDMSRITPV